MRTRRQRGAVFVVTLAILAGLTAIVATVAVSQRVAVKAQINEMDRERAKLVAEAGVQRAITTLCDESSSGLLGGSSNSSNGSGANLKYATTLQDDWAQLGTTGTDKFQLQDGFFRLQILDASSRMNLNTATQAQLANLPILTEQVDAILDWRSTGETPRSDGAKDSYYNGLSNPYDASLVPFSTLSELLDVRYFGPADLYDPSTNQSGSNPLPNFPDGRTPTLAELLTVDSTSALLNNQGTALRALTTLRGNLTANLNNNRPVNIPIFGTVSSPQAKRQLNTALGQTTWAGLIRSYPALTTQQVQRLLNTYYIGTSSTPTGRINPNTASAAVLQTIPNLTSDQAQSIVNLQSNGITQLGNLLTINGMTSPRTAARYLDYFAIDSQVFIVRVVGTVGTTTVPLEAIIKITPATSTQTSATAQIIRMEEQPFQDMTGRWGWQSATANDVPLEAGS